MVCCVAIKGIRYFSYDQHIDADSFFFFFILYSSTHFTSLEALLIRAFSNFRTSIFRRYTARDERLHVFCAFFISSHNSHTPSLVILSWQAVAEIPVSSRCNTQDMLFTQEPANELWLIGSVSGAFKFFFFFSFDKVSTRSCRFLYLFIFLSSSALLQTCKQCIQFYSSKLPDMHKHKRQPNGHTSV